ncbi:MAG: CdaR family protein [Chloroflexota bacterium]
MLGVLRRNVPSLVLSLGLSFTLWAMVVNQTNPEETKVYAPSIPITLRNVPTGLVSSRVREETVKLQITTTQDHWDSVSTSSFRAYIDLKDAGVGAREYKVQVESTDPRVRVAQVDPEQTEVVLAVQKKKTVPIRVNIVDTVPFGYEAQDPKVTPSEVEIVGAQDVVESVAAVVLDVPLSGARNSISQTLKPEALDGTGKPVKGIEMNPPLVDVEVPIQQQVAYKLVPVVPDIAGTVALGYQIVGITPDPTTVTVVGDPQTLDRLTQVTTKPVNVDGLSNDLHESTEVVLPSGVSLARKQSIVVRVYVNSIQGRQTIRVSPSLKGVAEDMQVTAVPSTIDVTMSGPMPSLLQIRPEDVKAVVDVTGLEVGTHVLSPQIAIPTGLKVESLNPEQVVVTIK